MTNIFIFIMITITVIFININMYKLINTKVTYSHYLPHRKLIMVLILSIPWIFLFFPFTLDWNTYWALVIIRVPFTIIFFILLLIGLFLELKLYKKFGKHK